MDICAIIDLLIGESMIEAEDNRGELAGYTKIKIGCLAHPQCLVYEIQR